jgi:signal transduction histidine kinase
MGLALVKRVVEAHGATIDVETSPGFGTRMSLRWPDRDAVPVDVRDGGPVASPVPVQ